MNKTEEKTGFRPELKIEGSLVENGVKIDDKESSDFLSSRGYGRVEKDGILLAFHEALYLTDKGNLQVTDRNESQVSFEELLRICKASDESIWAKYLTYRDLRSRGYVVRGGFGQGIDFRVYRRGDYGKDVARFLVLGIQEGKPVTLRELAEVVRQCQSLKKDLILSVMNRRGEVVYYSISQLTMNQRDD